MRFNQFKLRASYSVPNFANSIAQLAAMHAFKKILLAKWTKQPILVFANSPGLYSPDELSQLTSYWAAK